MTPKSYTRVAPPVPDWKYGQRVDATESGRQYLAGAAAGFETFDSSDGNELEIFSLMLTGITPRAIAFISTRSEDGVDNLAPFSYFTMVGNDPPLVTFSAIYENRDTMKDTAQNVLTTKHFVVNIPSAAWIHQANATSMNSPYGVSEWGFAGLTKQESDLVTAPRVKECAFALECELFHHFQVKAPSGKPSAEVIYGKVLRVHLRKDMLVYSPNNRRPQVDSQKLNPVSRLGEISYATLGEAFRMPVPKWPKDGEQAVRESQEQRHIEERVAKEASLRDARHYSPGAKL